jgi:hypothetical protein
MNSPQTAQRGRPQPKQSEFQRLPLNDEGNGGENGKGMMVKGIKTRKGGSGQ